ncbi:MAG: ribosome biogenesis GTPase Der [Chloroflexi bacterium]|nr:ribosome biogenesis GTPase Der [Chloroflexota bacterium]
MSKPLLAVIGRPNVGKSTLFNRIIGERRAVTEDFPGTTRDRLYGEVEWQGRAFTIVDTGGLELDAESGIPAAVRVQALLAMDQADVLLFVVDASAGITPLDIDIANALRRSQKPLLVLANKAESASRDLTASEFYALGFEEMMAVSAYHGQGVADALDWVVEHLPAAEEELDAEPGEEVRVAIIGRPNVGKSSLINRLLGEQRVVVSELPGTTRDAIDTVLEENGRRYRLIDTAGIRRRGKIEGGAEQFSVLRALRALDRADVAVLVVDAREGVTDSDLHIAGFVQQRSVGLVVLMNKWDLLPRGELGTGDAIAHIRRRFDFAPYATIVLASALTGFHTGQVLEQVATVWDQRQARVSTSQLNAFVHNDLQRHQLTHRGKLLKTLYATQAGVNPPTFVFFVNDVDLVHFGYRRFVENELRRRFGFTATPIRLIFREREERTYLASVRRGTRSS